jgi:two-component system chemotaxis sensor kinase CheA
MPEIPEDLRQLVDELSLALVLDAPEAEEEWLESVARALAAISASSLQASWEEGSRVAQDLSEAVRERVPDLRERLSSGSGELRSLLDALSQKPAGGASSLGEDPELVSDFVVESREHLSSIELQLLTLEQDPKNFEAIHSVFRSFHTIKGLAGFLQLAEVQEVAHDVETALDMARNAKLAITPEVIDVVLAGADYLSQWLNRLQTTLDGGQPPAVGSPQALLARVRAVIRKADEAPEPEVVPEASQIAAPEVVEATPAQARKAAADRTVKIDTGKLDYLVDMVGELVIAQSLVRHDPTVAGSRNDTKLARNLSQMARITDEVQKTAMSMRMVTVSRVFQKMARLVRDLGRKSAKQVEFESVGEDTELDRNIVEELADPLMHMVRNSIDHGVETPEERAAAGKSATAKVRLKACHQSGHILIEVCDDGKGLDAEKILRKAREKGLISGSVTPTEAETFNLIFQPGFSTAAKVTDVSGRGVGMDVVRRHIQKLRGRIEIQSVQGQGTTFLIKLPLTLAIIDGLVVGVGEERYIIPIYAVREMLRPAEEMVFTVEGRNEMVKVRNQLVPLVRLHQAFDVEPRSVNPWESLIIVAESEDKVFCLMVDELIGKQEVVIKSLGESFGHVRGIAGAAILGDGRVGLILDVSGLYGRQAEGV